MDPENVRFFDGAIERAGVRTVLYMTWARQDAPESQKPLTGADTDTGIGREHGATIVPGGGRAGYGRDAERGQTPGNGLTPRR